MNISLLGFLSICIWVKSLKVRKNFEETVQNRSSIYPLSKLLGAHVCEKLLSAYNVHFWGWHPVIAGVSAFPFLHYSYIDMTLVKHQIWL